MSRFKMKRGQESKVNSLAKEDGSLIFSLNGANNSTVRLDQTVNGTVQRLGIAVDKAKDADGVIDYNEPTRHIKIGYSGAGLNTSNLSFIAGYTNNGTQIKDVSKDVLKDWLGASDSANKLNPTVTLTNEGSNTPGYRLIATISLNAWSNYRAVFIAGSRHQGAGYLTITVGNNSDSITYDNVYSEITYWGPVGSGSVIAFDSYQVRVSSDGKKAYVFWKYWDYSPTAIYVISSDFTISNGTWMTSIAEASYGKVKAYTSINNAQSLQGSSLSQILNTTGGGNAFTSLDTTINNKIKLTRANGGTVEKTINNVANATSAENASHLGGKPSSDYALKADLSGDINALSAKRLPSYQSVSVANSFFYRYGTAGNTSDGGAWTGFPSATLYSEASTANGFGSALFQKKVGVLHLASGSSAHDLVFQAGGTNGGIAYVATGRNPAYILDTLNYKDKAYTFNKLTASSTFTATSGVVIDGGSY